MGLTFFSVALLIALVWAVFDRSLVRAIIVAIVPGSMLSGFLLAFSTQGTPLADGALTIFGGLIGLGVGLGIQKVLFKKRSKNRSTQKTPVNPKTKEKSKKPKGHQQLMSMIDKQREKVDRLIAGNVQLFDMGKLFESDDTRPQMSKKEAMDLAEKVAKKLLSPTDMVIRHGQEGLIFLFDGLTLDQAEQKSREIADAISEALSVDDKECPFVAQGFAHELDEFLGDGVIDSVDDLIRLVKIAHDAYMQKEKGVAKELNQSLKLVFRSVLDPQNLTRIGSQIEVHRHSKKSMKPQNVTFGSFDPGLSTELDCIIVEKLTQGVKQSDANASEPLFLTVRYQTLINPLYLDNYLGAIQALPDKIRKDLVFCLIMGDEAPARMGDFVKGLKRFGQAVFLSASEPLKTIEKAKGAGITGMCVQAPDKGWSDEEKVELKAMTLATESRKMQFMIFGVKTQTETVTELGIPFSSALSDS